LQKKKLEPAGGDLNPCLPRDFTRTTLFSLVGAG